MNILKILCIFSFIAISGHTMDRTVNDTSSYKNDCCCQLPCEPIGSAYNFPYVLKPSCANGLFFTGSYLYWQAKGLNLELGVAPIPVSFTTEFIHYKMVKMKFDFNSGFKAGVGYFFDHDNWTLTLDYTRYTNKNRNEKNVGTSNGVLITNVWLESTVPATSGSFPNTNFIKGIWSLKYNILDLMLSREFFVGKQFILNAAFGLNGGWIDQKYYVEGEKYRTAPTLAVIHGTSDNTSDTWLIGPKAFLGLNWIAYKNFKVFGNIAASIFYQHFRVNSFQLFPQQANTSVDFIRHGQDEFNYFNPSFESSIGFGYTSCTYANKFRFDANISYDFKYLWNQNFLDFVVYATSSATPLTAYPLMMQGLCVSLGLDF